MKKLRAVNTSVLHYKNEKFIHNVIYIKKVKATPKKYPRD
jgi:hypothetical protein